MIDLRDCDVAYFRLFPKRIDFGEKHKEKPPGSVTEVAARSHPPSNTDVYRRPPDTLGHPFQ